MKKYFLSAGILSLLLSTRLIAQENADLRNFPKGSTPLEIGKLVADHFIETPHTNFGRPTPPKVITYPETCTWYGALTFSKVTGNKTMLQQLADRFESFFGKDSSMIPVPDHVDYSVFGTVPLELYMQTKDKKYLELGKRIADNQWATPSSPLPCPRNKAHLVHDKTSHLAVTVNRGKQQLL